MIRPKRAGLSGPERPTSPPVRPVPAILERNLERYPWARLSENKGSLDELQLLLDAAGEEGRAWIVTASEAARLPGPFEADLYVALCQLYNERIPRERRATDRTITASFREVLALMGCERGGSQYAAVREGLERLADARVRAVQTWRVGELVAREEGIWTDATEFGAALPHRFTGDHARLVRARVHARQEPMTPCMDAATAHL